MATNDFIGFASSGSANVMSQADYAAAVEQGNGVQPGMASSALANKVWRQGANMAAALGEIISAQGGDALDNGDIAMLAAALSTALSKLGITQSGTTAGYGLIDNILISWGFVTATSSGAAVTFPRAYSVLPRICLTPQPANISTITQAQCAFAVDRSVTGFKAGCTPASSLDCAYFAIGIGA